MNRAPDSQIIARRRLDKTDAKWTAAPGATMTIAAARAAYDDGLIEIAQGRDGDYATLYAIPRRHKAERLPWFGRMER